jgi:hypothetical protein
MDHLREREREKPTTKRETALVTSFFLPTQIHKSEEMQKKVAPPIPIGLSMRRDPSTTAQQF